MRYETLELKVPGQQTGAARLTAYLLDPVSVAPQKRRPAVIVVPGGGYSRRSDREKEPIAMQFLAMGCHALVLDYSVAPNRFPVSLRELALAVAEIRGRGESWLVDPDRILVCGFSAGGHLACSLGAFWNQEEISVPLGVLPGQIRPDGLILCYPVITSGPFCHAGSISMLLGDNPGEELLRKVSLEYQVTAAMPPVFLWHTMTDEAVPVENSLLLLSALRRAGVSAEFHLFPEGVHGLALANRETGGTDENRVVPGCQSWISLVKLWIERFESIGHDGK